MKVFVSWSGELSKQIAESLKKWIPCMFNYVDVFFSQDDIERGENWDRVISKELSECNYGIICLTKDNLTAPWINFEAGAIAKSLDAKVSALMIDIKPSDIRGPLSRYQATKLNKADIFKLVSSINSSLDTPLDVKVLENSFNMMWPGIEEEMKTIVEAFSNIDKFAEVEATHSSHNDTALEEILQILRSQNSLLSNPELLLPIDYLTHIRNTLGESDIDDGINKKIIIPNLLNYFDRVLLEIERIENKQVLNKYLYIFQFIDLMEIVSQYINSKGTALQNRMFFEQEHRFRRTIRISKRIVKRKENVEDEIVSEVSDIIE